MSPNQRSRGGRFNCVQPSSAVLTVFAAPRLHNVGGLTQLLKAKGLASSVDGSIDEFTRSFVVLTAYIGLTPQGLQRWPEVVSALFSYLALLREEGVPPHVYAEERRMRELAFAFAEPAPPSSFVQSASGNLFLFPPREWLRGPLLAGEGAEPLVRSILEGLTPQAAVVKLTARELAPLATRVEPVYSASYGEMPIGREVAAWSAAPRLDGLAVPPPNRFIPTDLSIKALSIKARGASTAQGGGGGAARRVKPALLLNTDSVRLHFLQAAWHPTPNLGNLGYSRVLSGTLGYSRVLSGPLGYPRVLSGTLG